MQADADAHTATQICDFLRGTEDHFCLYIEPGHLLQGLFLLGSFLSYRILSPD